MPGLPDRFRASDVTRWGIVALVCGGLAVLSANVSALMPQGWLAGLHASRLDGASLTQLRSQVSSLTQETARLRRENTQLAARFALAEQNQGVMVRRIGALEVSIPALLEAVPPGTVVDRDAVTAGLGTPPGETRPAEGGAVRLSMVPLPQVQTMPALTGTSFGVALEDLSGSTDLDTRWDGLVGQLGPLLLALQPHVNASGTLIAGPLPSSAAADLLCDRADAVGVACTVVDYDPAL